MNLCGPWRNLSVLYVRSFFSRNRHHCRKEGAWRAIRVFILTALAKPKTHFMQLFFASTTHKAVANLFARKITSSLSKKQEINE